MSSLGELAIIPLSIQAILYGLYLASLFHCLRWLIFDDQGWKSRHHINWPMLSIALIIFSLLTIDLVLELQMAIGPALEVDVIEYERQNVNIRSISNSGRLVFNAALIYHCWVFHANSWRVKYPPLILWLSCLASFIALIYYDITLPYTTDIQPAFAPSIQISKFLILFYSCNMVTTTYATVAIMYQLLRITKGIETSISARVYRILAESGALYTLTSALLLVSVAVDAEFSFGKDLFRALSGTINFSTAGICLNLILIRVGQSQTTLDPSRSVLQFQSNSTSHIMSSLHFYVSHYPSQELSVVLADDEQTIASTKSRMSSVT